jgi:hypothetical protein
VYGFHLIVVAKKSNKHVCYMKRALVEKVKKSSKCYCYIMRALSLMGLQTVAEMDLGFLLSCGGKQD